MGLFDKKKTKDIKHMDVLTPPELTESQKKDWMQFWVDEKSGQIPINIIRQRGNAVEVVKTRGRVKKISKDSEIFTLQLSNKKQVDSIDYTMMNRDGSITLTEKSDGELVYSKVSDDVITSTGEGLLRDAFVVNDMWTEENFRRKEDMWAKIVPLGMFFVAVIGILGILYFNYGYFTDTFKGMQTMLENSQKSSDENFQTMERISQTQSQMMETMQDVVSQLKRISTDSVVYVPSQQVTTTTIQSTLNVTG
jgi:hypothetical protein